MPSIMAGVNQTLMLALSCVVIAGLVGSGGLGAVVVRGISTLDVGAGFEGGLAVVFLAIYLDRLTSALAQAPPSPRQDPPSTATQPTTTISPPTSPLWRRHDHVPPRRSHLKMTRSPRRRGTSLLAGLIALLARLHHRM